MSVIRVGRGRTIVIPRSVAERFDIDEGSMLLLEVNNDKIMLKPLLDAVTLALKGERIAIIDVEDIEGFGGEMQRKYVERKLNDK
jgi:AbrB family looped-hinge helix DNA binding protein